MPSAEPLFSASDLGHLFGLADGTAWTIVKRWIADGALSAHVRDGKTGSNYGRTIQVAPAAVLTFVRQHPDAYDWRKITDPPLKAEAERIEKRDPLVPLEHAIAGKELTKADVLLLAKKGTPGVVVRFSGRGRDVTREYFIRRSALSKLTAQIEKERLRSDPLAALHALLEAPQAAPSQVTSTSVDGHPATVARPAAVPAAPGQPSVSEDARRCPQCGTRRIVSPSLDGFELACMACGQSDAIVDPDVEARREAKRQAEAAQLAAESRGPGRPKAVAS